MPNHAYLYNLSVALSLIFLPLLANHSDLCHSVRGYWFRDISVPAPAAAAPTPPAAAESEPAQADTAAEARRYAVIYPDRAARIRAAGGLPSDLDFGPPEPALVAALLKAENGVSPHATLAHNSKQ